VELTSSESILKDLLKAQELQDAQIDSRMESQSSLVWSQGGIELDTIASVDLWLSLVILPHDTELDDAFGDGDDLEGSLIFGILFEERAVFEG
jgi:hypothetical protein